MLCIAQRIYACSQPLVCIFTVQMFHSSDIESWMKNPAIAGLLRDLCIVLPLYTYRPIKALCLYSIVAEYSAQEDFFPA